MEEVYRFKVMLSTDWKLPLNIAIGLHVLILLGALYLPQIFKAKPKFADIYTVSIINIADPVKKPPVTTIKEQDQAPAVSNPEPKIDPQKIAPIAEKRIETPPKIQPTPVKAVSLKPLKKKKIQKVEPPENKNRRAEIERQKRQKLAEALREEELLAQRAKLAQDALEAERKLLQNQPTVSAPQQKPTTVTENGEQADRTTATPAGSSNLIESQYLASVFNRLHQYWAPPEYLQQNPDLTTVVVITINQDGNIANTLFESKSGDRVFDQFVSKTIDAASPMPPIPAALRKQRFEVGLRFRPGSIQ